MTIMTILCLFGKILFSSEYFLILNEKTMEFLRSSLRLSLLQYFKNKLDPNVSFSSNGYSWNGFNNKGTG